MTRKSWSTVLIVLGIALIGLGGYAMSAWEEAVDMCAAWGITESMLEEAMRQPGAKELMSAAMDSNGDFWYYAVIYRIPILIGGFIGLIAGIVMRKETQKEPTPWAMEVPRVTPSDVKPAAVRPAPAPAPAPAPVRYDPAPAKPASANTRSLVGQDGALAGRSFQLNGKAVIGRSRNCQIVYPSDTKGVSGVHCTVRFNGSAVTVTDENSSYGTYLDGKRLTPGHATVMHRGQLLQLGSGKQSLKLRS